MEPIEPLERLHAGDEWRRLNVLQETMMQLAGLPDEELLFTPADTVSGWAVAAHLFHVSTTNFGVARLLPRLMQGSVPASTSAVRSDALPILLHGALPSGLDAPAGVVPPEALDRDALVKRIGGASQQVAGLEAVLPELATATVLFDHPYLGPLTPAEWLRLMTTHTVHHLRIADRVLEHLRRA